MKLILDGHNLTLDSFVEIAQNRAKVIIAPQALKKTKLSYDSLLKLSKSDKSLYGVNTGFGSLKNTRIKSDELVQLQINLLRSHACGVGPLFSTEISRGIMLLSLNCMIKGFSGISPAVVEQIATYLNKGIHPLIPSQGSVGSSGDLAPLSHYALTLIGEGKVEYENKVIPTAQALKKAGLKPVELGPKSGLALINGTHAMASVGAIALHKAKNLARTADISLSMSLEALRGSKNAFRKEVHELRPHSNQIISARNITTLLKDSQLEKVGLERESVQDAYSLRCAPQVHGASRQVFQHVEEVLIQEFNSVTDNPLIINDEIISAGHFHGQPLAVVFDYLSIGLAELANISERRTERLVNSQLSKGLPAFLVSKPGLNSGFMIVQYAAAALVSENKSLAHPASVDSIPTSGNQEDHVSMGTIAARKANQIADNVTQVLAIELMTAAQALELLAKQNNLKSPHLLVGKTLGLVFDEIRKTVTFVKEDRFMSDDLGAMAKLVASTELVKLVKKHSTLD